MQARHPCVLLTFIAASLGFVGCAPSPQILKRYHTADFAGAPHDPKLFVSVFAVDEEEPASAPPKLAGLSDRGQAAYIEAAAKLATKPDDIKSAVSKPFASAATPAIDPKRVTFSKRLVISLRKSGFRPADRLSEATVRIDFPPSIRVLSWEKLANDYVKVDQGSLSLQQGNKIDVSTGVTLPQASLQISGEKSNQLTETTQLAKSYIRLSGEIGEHSITLYQQGDTQVDIGGTVVATVKLAFEPGLRNNSTVQTWDLWHFKGLFTTKDETPRKPKEEPPGKTKDDPSDKAQAPKPAPGPKKPADDAKRLVPQDAAKITVSRDTVQYANCSGGVKPVSVRVDYVTRMVESGDDTLDEGDDRVVFRPGEASVPSKPGEAPTDPSAVGEVIRAEDKEFDYFVLVDRIDGHLSIGDPSGTPPPSVIAFETYADAFEFKQWLWSSPHVPQTVGLWALSLGLGGKLTKDALRRLDISRLSMNREPDGSDSAGSCQATPSGS